MSIIKKYINRIKSINPVVYEALNHFVAPTILSVLATCVVTFLNTIVAGYNLGKIELAAMSFGSSFTFIYAMVGCLVGIGGALAASSAIGKHDEAKARSITSISLILALVLPLLVTGVLMVIYEPYLQANCGGEIELYETSREFIRITILTGTLTTFMYYPFNFLKVQGRSKQPLIMFGVLIVTDAIFLFASLKMGLGVKGIAYTVAMSLALCDLTGVLLLIRKGGETAFGRIYDFWRCTGEIIRMGLSAAVNNLCNFLRTICLNYLFLKYMGSDGVSILAAASAVLNLATSSVAGMGQAVAPILGVFYAEKDNGSIKSLMMFSLIESLIIQIAITAVGAAFCVPLTRAFGLDDPAYRDITARAFIFVLISLIVGGVNSTMIFYYTTIKKTVMSVVLTVLRSFAFQVLFCYLCIINVTDEKVFLAFIIAECATLAVNVLWWLVLKRKNKSYTNWFLLEGSGFDSDRLYITTAEASFEGFAALDESIHQYVENTDLDMKKQMCILLAIEEMIAVVGQHAYDEKSEFKPIDIRLYVDEDGAVLRLRYLGKLFDPIEYSKQRKATLSAEELLLDDSVGISMIEGMASESMYARTLGMNNLIVVV